MCLFRVHFKLTMIDHQKPESIPDRILEIGSEFNVPFGTQPDNDTISRASGSKSLKLSKHSSVNVKSKLNHC